MDVDKWLEDRPEWRKHVGIALIPPTSDEVAEEFPDSTHSEIVKDDESYTTYGVTRLALYLRLRREGQTHRFAEMIAMQQPPGCGVTDDVLFQGMPRLADQMHESQFKAIMASAKRQGFTPSADSIYMSGLARFPGDKEAFVTRAMGRSYIKKLCEQRGWACEGAVKVEHRQPENDPLDDRNCTPLAEDLVIKNAAKMIKKNPDLGQKTKAEMRKMVIDKYGPSS